MFVELIDSTGQSVSGCLVSCQTTEEAARSVIYSASWETIQGLGRVLALVRLWANC
jgi:hypothetical protein